MLTPQEGEFVRRDREREKERECIYHLSYCIYCINIEEGSEIKKREKDARERKREKEEERDIY